MTAIFLTVAQFFVFLGFGLLMLVGVMHMITDLEPNENNCVN